MTFVPLLRIRFTTVLLVVYVFRRCHVVLDVVGHLLHMTPEQMQAFTLQRELDERNRPLADDELEALLPPGYKVYCACSYDGVHIECVNITNLYFELQRHIIR